MMGGPSVGGMSNSPVSCRPAIHERRPSRSKMANCGQMDRISSGCNLPASTGPAKPACDVASASRAAAEENSLGQGIVAFRPRK
jgi:hypothetical protein